MPATSGTIEFAKTAVDDAPQLAGVDATAFSDGDLAFLRTTGKYYHLVRSSSATPDNVMVITTKSGVGRWLAGPSANETVFSVTDVASLSTVNDTVLGDGTLIWVKSRKRYFQLDKINTDSVESGQVVATQSGTGRFVSLDWTTSIHWSLVYGNCFVDPTNSTGLASDDNTGQTSALPLLTYAEAMRRVLVVRQPITFNQIGPSPVATDFPTWNPITRWDRTISATQPTINFLGIETATTLPTNGTGVINTATNGTAATNTPPRLTDTGGAGVVWTAGMIIRAATGEWCRIQLNEGGGVARTSLWRTAAGTATATPPVGGTAYTVVLQTVFADFAVTSDAPINLTKIRLTAWTAMSGGVNALPCLYTLTNCVLPSSISFIAVGAGMTMLTQSCSLEQTATLVTCGALYSIVGCGTATTNTMRCTYGGRLSINNTVMQGQGAQACSAADSQAGGQISISNVGIFDSTTVALVAQRGGEIFINNTLWGANNALQGVQARGGGRIFVKTGQLPTLASLGQELELENATTASAAPPLGTGVIPPAVALINWAQWQAGPFTRNVMSYFTGSAILDAA